MKVYIYLSRLVEASRILGRGREFVYNHNAQCAVYELSETEYEQVKDYAQTEASLRHASDRAAALRQAEQERRETIRHDAIAFLERLLCTPQ